MSSDRYAAVARTLLPQVSALTSTALAASANAAGPVRDGVVALADALNEVTKDTQAFADGGEPAAFAKAVGEVAAAWTKLGGLADRLAPDADLQRAIARGRSFTVTVRADPAYVVTAGPYANALEADAAAKRIGAVLAVTRSAPYVVRVAAYPTRTAADAAVAALKAKGVDVASVTEERTYVFSRGQTAPDVELWREPARVFDTWNAARRVALSPDGRWLATGSDDGTVAIFSAQDGALFALPRFNAGVSQLLFSRDSAWLFAGGAAATVFFVPQGSSPLAVAQQMRFPAAISQVVYVGVPTGRAFVGVSKGPTGLPAGGGGLIGARAPDGAVIGAPFPITTPAAGGFLGVSDRGEVFIATTTAGGTDVELLRIGSERFTRGVIRVPGAATAFAVDPRGDRAAIVTDQGTFRFLPHDLNPTATLARLSGPVRDLAFGADGALLALDKDKVVAFSADGARRWDRPLVDGRRIVPAARSIVLDGAGTVWAIAGDGTVDALGVDGTVQDLAASADGARVAVVVDGRRALVFQLQ